MRTIYDINLHPEILNGYILYVAKAAVDDDTAVKALVLGRSLRRSVTSRKIAVVVSKPVSDKLRWVLGCGAWGEMRQSHCSSANKKYDAVRSLKLELQIMETISGNCCPRNLTKFFDWISWPTCRRKWTDCPWLSTQSWCAGDFPSWTRSSSSIPTTL